MSRPTRINEDREAYLAECLNLDMDTLNDEFIKLPAAVAFWNARYSEATLAAATAKLEYEREYARMFVAVRNRPDPKTGKPPAIDAVKYLCDDDDDLFGLQKEMAERDAERLRLRGICDAILAKRDMLQSLGAKLREEMRGDPRLRGAQSDDFRGNALTG